MLSIPWSLVPPQGKGGGGVDHCKKPVNTLASLLFRYQFAKKVIYLFVVSNSSTNLIRNNDTKCGMNNEFSNNTKQSHKMSGSENESLDVNKCMIECELSIQNTYL